MIESRDCAHFFVGQKWKLLSAYENSYCQYDGRIYEIVIENGSRRVGLVPCRMSNETFPPTSRAGFHLVKDRGSITKSEWDCISGCGTYKQREWILVENKTEETVGYYSAKDIENRINKLGVLIKSEKNAKEKARLVNEQASLILTTRIIPKTYL